MWKVLCFCWAVGHALREEGGMPRDKKKYIMPRKCSGWKLDKSKCCSCGERTGSYFEAELESWVNSCEVVKGNVVSGAACCPVWATDCKEDEPEFAAGLKRDCRITQADCDEAQCFDVKQALDHTEYALEKLKRDKSRELTYQEKGFVTGTSNHNKFCDCACGEITDKAKMLCKNLNEKGLFCKGDKPCCSNLKDCDVTDPWPKAVAETGKRIRDLRDGYNKRLKQLQQEVKELKQLRKDCYRSCKVTQEEACIEDLKVVEKEGGWFDTAVTRQELVAQKFYSKLFERALRHERDRDTVMKELVQQQKDRQKKLNEERKAKWRKDAYVNLQNFVAGAEAVFNEHVQRQECCKCTMVKNNEIHLFGTTMITDFCSAPSCDVFEGMCSSTSKNYCAKRYTACPADHGYYARGGDKR